MPNKKSRIIVLEDDRVSRRLVAHILEQAGYEVIECSEGRDAIHLAQMHPPQAMIVDVMLPDMRGTQVVGELKKYPQCRDVKSIFLTGILKQKAGDATRAVSFKVEGEDYPALPKPLSPSVLLPLLRRSLGSWHALSADQEPNQPMPANTERKGIGAISAPVERQPIIENIDKSPLWKR